MRTFLLASALAGIAASDCTTNHLTAVSQHMKGTGVTKQHVEAEGQPATDMVVKMNISSSFDVDGLNMVQSVQASTYVNNQTVPFTMDQILNWKQGTITQRISTGTNAGQDPGCIIMRLPPFLPKSIKLMKLAIAAMERAYSCKGSANGWDTYAMDFPPSWLSVPSPLVVHTTVDVDQDHLVQRETVLEDVEMKGTKAHVESMFASDETAAGGPSEDELVVPDSWGSCVEQELDVEAMLKHTADGIHAVGGFRKLLHALHFIELAKEKEIAV
jgi:hypothetical protein